jgi:hypothetical protein
MLVTVVTVMVVIGGGTLVWLIERHAANSNLHRWGDSIWWSVTTLTTVGYGEHYPVTIWGRLVAVGIMFSGIGIIGAVAAVVAFGFAGRLATRLEAAVSQVESQVEHVEAEVENVSERVSPLLGMRRRQRTGLRELVIGVADSDTAASLTWLLARLGWHPEAGDNGVSWQDGGVLLRIAVRPWDMPFGVQGRLTFGAGSPERLLRIGREATRHGFHQLPSKVPAPAAGAAGAAVAAVPVLPGHGTADGEPITLRTASGFDVVLVTS